MKELFPKTSLSDYLDASEEFQRLTKAIVNNEENLKENQIKREKLYLEIHEKWRNEVWLKDVCMGICQNENNS